MTGFFVGAALYKVRCCVSIRDLGHNRIDLPPDVAPHDSDPSVLRDNNEASERSANVAVSSQIERLIGPQAAHQEAEASQNNLDSRRSELLLD